ncbi:MAG: hypothetical protein HQK49_22205 [Oligoflexia bacterium]|nr:hypothetical protein [Oligoflexia bacterium]
MTTTNSVLMKICGTCEFWDGERKVVSGSVRTQTGKGTCTCKKNLHKGKETPVSKQRCGCGCYVQWEEIEKE